MGNGTGNVADLQYLPALTMMNILKKYNATMTFMVEVAHQLELKKHTKHPNIKLQSKLWDDTVLLMKEEGFDVQLHLHPQWINAPFENGYFHVSKEWNIGKYKKGQQNDLVNASIDYLEDLIKPQFSDYKVCAFKAGSWGLQPFDNLYSIFKNRGINVVIGVRDGLTVEGIGIDYSDMEEKNLPYYPQKDKITHISKERGDLAIVPLHRYEPNLLVFARYAFNQLKTRKIYKSNLAFYHENKIPHSIKQVQPLSTKSLFKVGLKPYHKHLKIGNQTYSYLKNSFDTIINRLDRIDAERIPVVIESHTKQYHNHYADIERFIAYIAEKYEDNVEFGTLSAYSEEIRSNPEQVIYKKK